MKKRLFIICMLLLVGISCANARRGLELLDSLQWSTIRYMWDGAEPNSGMALERIHLDGTASEADLHTVTTGGTGFGLCGLIVGMERGWIDREKGIGRIAHIVRFLEKADRFHGMWPHWLDGRTGRVRPFSPKDDGGDVVESSFLMQGLLCVRQWLNKDAPAEQRLREQIDQLWREMEFDWYTRGGQPCLYWHWSPRYGWDMNLPIHGYNECLAAYVLALAHPTHSIPYDCYRQGWCRRGQNGAETTDGPLFWAHYSWIGICPRHYRDEYVRYARAVRNHVRRNYAHCLANPHGYPLYGRDCWGLTASYSPGGYSAHAPSNDLGVVSPTAALCSMPYLPRESRRMLQFLWNRRDLLWDEYGPIDAFSTDFSWMPHRYLAIDQLPIAPMVENYRTGLLWKLFMSCPEIRANS